MIFLRCIKIDLARCIFSRKFIIALLCMAAVNYISIHNLLGEAINTGMVGVLYLDAIRKSGEFSSLYLLCTAIFCVTLFCEDWENKYLRYNILRTGKSAYAVAKVFSTVVSIFLFILISEVLYYFIMLIFVPIVGAYDIESMFSHTMYEAMFSVGDFLPYFIIAITLKALSAGFFCSLALIISVKIPNIFVALSAPLLSYYFLDSVFWMAHIPNTLNPTFVGAGGLEIAEDPFLTLVYGASNYLFLIAVLCLIFLFFIDRRVESD